MLGFDVLAGFVKRGGGDVDWLVDDASLLTDGGAEENSGLGGGCLRQVR